MRFPLFHIFRNVTSHVVVWADDLFSSLKSGWIEVAYLYERIIHRLVCFMQFNGHRLVACFLQICTTRLLNSELILWMG